MWETTNSKLPTPILTVGQLEIGINSQIVFIALFSGSCYGLLCHLQTSGNCAKMLNQNHFAEPNWHVSLFFIQF